MRLPGLITLSLNQQYIDNLDYTEVKDLIKRYTISQPPVEVPEQKTEFEDELFEVLADQLGRVGLFG